MYGLVRAQGREYVREYERTCIRVSVGERENEVAIYKIQHRHVMAIVAGE